MSDKTKNHQLFVIINFGLIYLVWGSLYLALSVVVSEGIPPAMMGASRFGIAGAIMLLVCALLGKKVAYSPAILFRLGIIGVLLLTCQNLVLAWALQYVPSGMSALLLATVPLWVVILETAILRKERLARRGILGIALGLCGLAILLWPRLMKSGEIKEGFFLASVFLLVAALAWALGSVLSRHWELKVDPFSAAAWEMLFAGLVNFAIALSLGDLHRVVWTPHGVAALSYLIIAGSWISFTAYIWLLKNVPTAKVATHTYVNPVVAVFLGWLVLQEKVDAYVYVGAAIILASAWLVNSSKVTTKAG